MFEFSRSLGKAVKDARMRRGLTQNDVADAIGIDGRTVLNIENLKGNPKMEILYPLIRFLRVDANDVFYGEREAGGPLQTQLQLLISSCSEEEIAALIPVCEAVLSALQNTDYKHIK